MKSHHRKCVASLPWVFVFSCILAACCVVLPAQVLASDTLIVREALGLTLPRRTVARVIPATPLDVWVAGRRTDPPREGESHQSAEGKDVKWQRVVADAQGWFPSDPPGERYAAVSVARKAAGVMILEAMGHDFALVNGTLRSGNPYRQKDTYDTWEPRFDYSRIPVELQEGQNLLMFRYARGGLKVRLVQPVKPVAFETTDLTMPDAVAGSPLEAWGSVLVINAGTSPFKGGLLVCTAAEGVPDSIGVPSIPPLGVRKVAFRIHAGSRTEEGSLPLRLSLISRGQNTSAAIDDVTIPLRVVGAMSPRRETFVSGIDGSIQYYAVTPAGPVVTPGRPALFLSLHGAGVEAINQAASYEPKRWGYVVAPTNRRPYGFSWEDWGRLDALEVLDLVTRKFGIDENRVYLTGHSMGGHGTWFMSATYPDKFAAIGPSAGWITFHSYRFTNALDKPSRVQQMLKRPALPSDLFSLADNYRHFGVYIIHGSVDDNVPPQQSAMMIERLKPIHTDFVFHEEPGAGHWWDNSPEPGADCVDWRPMFDFFARHARPGPDRIRTIEFTTANPGISSRDSWITIDAQEHQLAFSTVRVHVDPGLNRVQGTTTNVARIAIDAGILRSSAPATVELDSQKTAVKFEGATDRLWFLRDNGQWRQVPAPPAEMKTASRNGTFKEVFRNRMVLVYGTGGNAQENHWAYERARYDAEKLWYQGNATVDVLADTEFDPAHEPDRNVVLYGNSQTNRLWRALLPDCPVTVERNRVLLGEKRVNGKEICCIFVRPRPNSATASVGVVSGTGVEGMRLTHLVMYLEPGLGLPDLTVFSSDVLSRGDAGIIQTGFFGQDWSLTSGEFESGQ